MIVIYEGKGQKIACHLAGEVFGLRRCKRNEGLAELQASKREGASGRVVGRGRAKRESARGRVEDCVGAQGKSA